MLLGVHVYGFRVCAAGIFLLPGDGEYDAEEIDYIFGEPDKGAVKWLLEMRRERVNYGRRESMAGHSSSRQGSMAGSIARGPRDEAKDDVAAHGKGLSYLDSVQTIEHDAHLHGISP